MLALKRGRVRGLKQFLLGLTLLFELLCGLILALTVLGFQLLDAVLLLLVFTLAAIGCLAAANFIKS